MPRSSVVLLLLIASAGCAERKPPPDTKTTAAPIAPAAPAATLLPAPASAAAPGASFDTPAGKLSITAPSLEPDTMTLAGKPFYPPACAAGDAACAAVRANYETDDHVEVVGRYLPKSGSDLVVLFKTGMLGNACNGGPLFFVRFKADGTARFSDLFDHCGGPEPKVVHEGDTVTITVRDHQPNRGTGTIKGYGASYDLGSGKLTQLKPSRS